jgi:hypothetical protein
VGFCSGKLWEKAVRVKALELEPLFKKAAGIYSGGFSRCQVVFVIARKIKWLANDALRAFPWLSYSAPLAHRTRICSFVQSTKQGSFCASNEVFRESWEVFK